MDPHPDLSSKEPPAAAPAYGPVLWDVDGTIIDSGPEILDRITRVITESGYAVPEPEVLRGFIGPPLIESFQKIIGMSHDEAERAIERSRAIARDRDPDDLVTLNPGVAELIRDLHRAGVPQATASSKGEWLVQKTLTHFGLAPCFDLMAGSDSAAGRVTKSEVLAHALEHYRTQGVDTSRALLIGDRIHDLEGGQQLRVPVIIVGWGYGDGEATPGALARVDTPQQLRTMLGL